MDYNEKVQKLKDNACTAENLLKFRNKVSRVIELFREESKVTVCIENHGFDAKAYPSKTSESCPVFEEFREGVIEALKAQLERANQELEEMFKEA